VFLLHCATRADSTPGRAVSRKRDDTDSDMDNAMLDALLSVRIFGLSLIVRPINMYAALPRQCMITSAGRHG